MAGTVTPAGVAIGLQPETIRGETAVRIDRSNELGREIIGRFIAYVANSPRHHRP